MVSTDRGIFRAVRRPATVVLAWTAVAAATFVPAMAADESREVTLRMKGGGFQVTGEIRSFDGNRYVVETPQFGRMTLQAARFECIGAACSTTATQAGWVQEVLSPERHEAIALRGADVIADQALPALLRGYASGAGLTLVTVVGSEPGVLRYRLADRRGKDVATVEIHRDETVAAIESVERGTATIAMSDRAATKEETDGLAAAGPKSRVGPLEHMLGIDGLAFIVSPDHQATSLPIEALARILAGQLTDWYELGLPQGRIRVLLRDGAGEAAERLQGVLLKPRNLKLAADFERLGREADISDAVARDRNAIGVVSLMSVRNARALNIETACGLIQRPTVFAVRSGEYPLTRRLFLHALAPPKQAVARELLRFASTPEAQAALADTNLASQAVEALPFADQSERMAFALNAQGEAFDLGQMRILLADLKGARRLSTTTRYAAGSSDLETISRQEAQRIAALLMSQEYSGKRVLIAAFTDANGAKFATNLTATYKRAGQVRAALLTASGQKLDHRLLIAKGYGPLAPVACNETPEGARLNRRVEIWIKD